MIRRISGRAPILAALVAATVAVVVAACGSFTGVPASLINIIDSGTVYALNGSPPGAPTALAATSGVLLAANSSFVFDVAFDIDSAGNVVYLPQRAVASGLASTHQVGLQKLSTAYDSLANAPKSGYRADTALVAAVNQTVVLQIADPSCSVSITGTTLYAKVVVTKVDPVAKQLTVQYSVDPNCGFVSFALGVPKN